MTRYLAPIAALACLWMARAGVSPVPLVIAIASGGAIAAGAIGRALAGEAGR